MLVNDFTYSDGRREAQAWVAHRLTWERVLTDLRARAEETGEPVPFTLPDDVPAAAA